MLKCIHLLFIWKILLANVQNIKWELLLTQCFISPPFIYLFLAIPSGCGILVFQPGNQTCIGRAESQPLDHQGSPHLHYLFFKKIYLFLIEGWLLYSICVGFCQTSIWISHRYTRLLPLEPPSHLPPTIFLMYILLALIWYLWPIIFFKNQKSVLSEGPWQT